MKSSFLAGVTLASGLLAFEARAEEPRAVTVAYTAPPECPSLEAFQNRVSAEVALAPRARTDWQYSLRVVAADGGYVGTLTSESGSRTVRGSTCEEAAAALARVIAGTKPPAPTSQAPASVEIVDASPAEDKPPARRDSAATLRLGARFQTWTHGAPSTQFGARSALSLGGMGTLSVELPWGIFHRTMFEFGLGAMESRASAEDLTYYVFDTQACLADIAFGESGLSLLGCLRLAGSYFRALDIYGTETGGALWGGVGARLRWQSRSPLFVEVHGNAVYGTVSGPEVNDPGWLDLGASLGIRL